MKQSKSKIKGIIEWNKTRKKSSQSDNELVYNLKKYDNKDISDKQKLNYAIHEQILDRLNSGKLMKNYYNKKGKRIDS